MTYGTKSLKNGKRTGTLTFASGKRVYLTHEERAELDEKIRYWQAIQEQVKGKLTRGG